MIVFSDLHLREESEEVVFGEVLPGIVKAGEESNDPFTAFLGDFFHFRYKVDARIQNLVGDFLQAHASRFKPWILLPGNHDQYDEEGRNALELYNEIEGVSVYTNPTRDEHGFWIPYRKYKGQLDAALAQAGGGCTLFMHHGIQGALMNDHYKNTEGLPPARFADFSNVLLGHYHIRQTVGNARYIGSPYQTRADESGQDKGYAIWDGQDLRYVTTRWGKRYHRLTVGAGEGVELEGIEPGDDVRVRAMAGVTVGEVAEQLKKAGIENHTVTPDLEPFETRLDVPANSPLREYAYAYLQEQETSYDKGALWSAFEGMTS